MGLPPSATRYFAKKHIEAAEKYLAAVEDRLFQDSQEDRRAFDKFYNNLALFSGGTIALSITYLGYLKTLNRILRFKSLLSASWVALFICLLFSPTYVLVNLYYSHHCREREWLEARKRKFETEAEELPRMGLTNIQTRDEIAAVQEPRQKAAKECAVKAEWHKKQEGRYHSIWVWSGRIARLSFIAGIGILLWFAILNS